MTSRHAPLPDPRRRPIWSKAAIALAPLAVLAACSSGSGDGASEVTTTTVDVAAIQEALEARLLGADDLATADALDAGWVAGSADEGVDITLPECVVEHAGDDAVASGETKLVTDNDLKLPSVEQDLAEYAAGDAAAAFEAAAARLDACEPEFVFQGQPSLGQTERLPLTVTGAQSAAWRTTVTIAGAEVAITTIHVQEGDLETALVHVDLGAPDPVVLEDLAAKAVAKLS